jgi:magnesium chelatase family protein
VSGPLLDRIDIHIEVLQVRYKELSGEDKGETATEIRERVNAAFSVYVSSINYPSPILNLKAYASYIQW